MSGKAPNAILKRDKPVSEVPDRRVSWGNYRVREYLNLRDDSSPCGPLIDTEDLMSAPLGSGSSGSLHTPQCTYMNIEESPEEGYCCFSRQWERIPDLGGEDSPKQCVFAVVREDDAPSIQTPCRSLPLHAPVCLTPQSSASKSPAPKTPPRSILRSSDSKRKESLSADRPATPRSAPATPRAAEKSPRRVARIEEEKQAFVDMLIVDIRKFETAQREVVARMRATAAAGRQHIRETTDRIRQLQARIAQTEQAYNDRIRANEWIVNNKVLETADTVVRFLQQASLWKSLWVRHEPEGVVERFESRQPVYCRDINLKFWLQITVANVTVGEISVQQPMDTPELQSLADKVLPVFLPHFRQQTLRQSRESILDFATRASDRLQSVFLSFRLLYRDFSVHSCELSDKKIYTTFSFGHDFLQVASTSLITLESKLSEKTGNIYTLARGAFN